MLLLIRSAAYTELRRRICRLLPQSKSAAESVGVISRSAVRRELFQLLHIAPSQNYIIGFKGRDQTRHYIHDIAPPFFLASFFECLSAHIILIRPLLVREMTEFHGLDDATYNQCGAEPRAQSEE